MKDQSLERGKELELSQLNSTAGKMPAQTNQPFASIWKQQGSEGFIRTKPGIYRNQTEFKPMQFCSYGSTTNPEDVEELPEHGEVSAAASPVLPVRELGKHRRGASTASWLGGQRPQSEHRFIAKLGGRRKVAVQGLACRWGFPVYSLMRWEMEQRASELPS